MDRLIYIAMTGAINNMHGVSVHANNLANAKTTGFKGDFEQARSMHVFGEGSPTRAFAVTERPGQNFDAGGFVTTNRDLDVAIQGSGWFTVLDENGKEAYTRAGSLDFTEDGRVINAEGYEVVGETGSFQLPVPIEKVVIGTDGYVSVRLRGAPANQLVAIDRLKLVNPNVRDLHKLENGLFARKDGQEEQPADAVRVLSGSLEASNVNATSEMVNLIALQRQFEMSLKVIKSAEENDQAHSRLMRLT